MKTPAPTRLSAYQFQNTVALNGTDRIVYLSPDDAQALANQLAYYAEAVEAGDGRTLTNTQPIYGYHFTTEVPVKVDIPLVEREPSDLAGLPTWASVLHRVATGEVPVAEKVRIDMAKFVEERNVAMDKVINDGLKAFAEAIADPLLVEGEEKETSSPDVTHLMPDTDPAPTVKQSKAQQAEYRRRLEQVWTRRPRLYGYRILCLYYKKKHENLELENVRAVTAHTSLAAAKMHAAMLQDYFHIEWRPLANVALDDLPVVIEVVPAKTAEDFDD